MIVVNGGYPGPTIEADWGDWIQVTVHNKLKEGTALHWNGLLQQKTVHLLNAFLIIALRGWCYRGSTMSHCSWREFQVQGITTAAGTQLAAQAHLCVASPVATFSTPGVQLGGFC